jgi:DNA invertase Pin-like site-specific DNA recombinase
LWALFADRDVISLREKFDTSIPTGEAMVQLIMVFAQLERKMTAERTFSIMRDRADLGRYWRAYSVRHTGRADVQILQHYIKVIELGGHRSRISQGQLCHAAIPGSSFRPGLRFQPRRVPG